MPDYAYWDRWTNYLSAREKQMTPQQWQEILDAADLFHKDMTEEEQRDLARKIAKLAKKYAESKK